MLAFCGIIIVWSQGKQQTKGDKMTTRYNLKMNTDKMPTSEDTEYYMDPFDGIIMSKSDWEDNYKEKNNTNEIPEYLFGDLVAMEKSADGQWIESTGYKTIK